jgi:hypothetical protein
MPYGGAGLPLLELTNVEDTPPPTAPQQSPGAAAKKEALSAVPERAFLGSKVVEYLVGAAREQSDKHHQVRQGKQPLVRLLACRFRGARDEAQMAALRKIANVIDANSSQAGNFRVGKDLLARFYCNHGLVPLTGCHTARLLLAPNSFDAFCSVRDALSLEQ